ncbi:uncharacterized protein LOC131997853 [Stomoxys calcitrans]|uniref:uncharacterized protein LOC131997853 n=1 Tax=Stomoxys calcitrans TaxID=35570 RepID=UPI0027E2B335|nr:uncharacterized protein LOC131997853 [Stomoxys calcitrans]
MSTKYFIFLCFVVPNIFHINSSTRRFSVELYNWTCKIFNGNGKENIGCSFYKTATDDYILNARFFFDRELTKSADVRFKVDIKPQNANKRLTFFDFKLNLCDALTQGMTNIIVKNLIAELRKTSNIPYECPLRKDYEYKVNNYSFNAEMLPPYAPFLNFTYSLILYDEAQLYGKFQWMGALNSK